MSLNFIETILDKLSPKDSGNSILKNWTGSQGLIGSNTSLSDSILNKYQEALFEANDSVSTNLSIKRSPLESTMFPFQHSVLPNSLVSRVSKLFLPTALPSHDYNRRIPDINTNHQTSVNKINHPEVFLWEELMQEALNFAVHINKHHSSDFDRIKKSNNSPKSSTDTSEILDTITTICTSSPAVKAPNMVDRIKKSNNSPKSSTDTSEILDTIATIYTSSPAVKAPNMVVQCFVKSSPLLQTENRLEPEVTAEVLASSSKQEKGKTQCELDMAVIIVGENATVMKNKITADCGTLNHELANRKTKEMQKRSKNRRRRQKRSKSKNNVQKSSSSISDYENPIRQKLCKTGSSMSKIGCDLANNAKKCASPNSAFCNVINIVDNAKSVQIILPNVSSFVITVDSAGDDSDWDENSDSEWLNDTSEFEFSGLNVANLPCSKTNSSLLSVPTPQDEDEEALQLNMLLHRVNKEWNEATKDLDGKTRSCAKVSFVPDDELVEVLPVEVYERKGEWEMYALERLRFKRRIDELDKIISPCFSSEHREKILKKYHATDL